MSRSLYRITQLSHISNRPKPGLEIGEYEETIAISGKIGDKDVSAAVQAEFEVKDAERRFSSNTGCSAGAASLLALAVLAGMGLTKKRRR